MKWINEHGEHLNGEHRKVARLDFDYLQARENDVNTELSVELCLGESSR